MKQSLVLIFFSLIILLISCTKDVGSFNYASLGYPQDVAKIIVTKCAVTGCHNDISKGAVGGLSLETWDKLFEGSRGGAVIIPYRPDHSTFMYYTNSYDELGTIQLNPKMPIGSDKLSIEEQKVIYTWIKNGAPNANGVVKFSDNPLRKKFYVSNQGCDLITVFDAKSMLAMRAIDVGNAPNIEAPHFIKVSPDNKYWYVSFIGSNVFQKYSTANNLLVGQANIGGGSWNTFALSSDGKYAYVVDWSSPGQIKKIRTDDMIEENSLGGLIYPHGSAINKTDDTLYITAQTGNYLLKIPTDFSSVNDVVLDNSGSPSDLSSLDPHEVLLNQSNNNYYVTCQKSNQVKVLSKATDQVIATINVGDFPQEMAISYSKNYLFVTCMEDVTTFGSTKRGSVYVIDCTTFAVVAKVYTGHQPHGIMVDEVNKRVYVTNRNVASGGPAPHHASLCGGKNGYVTAIDLNTLKLVDGFKTEVSVDPYGYSITN
jgi:YVTN family beta-propeller protein